MFRILKAFLVSLALLGGGVSAHAVIIDSSTPIPVSEVLVNFNGTNLDWVYAGPVAPGEFGPGEIHPSSYRAAEGWRVATVAEWALRPDWDDFIKPGFTVVDVPANAGWTDHTKYRFTSEYWSNFMHVDLNDFSEGRVTDGLNGTPIGNVPETIYVRNSIASAIPEPGTWAMMLIGFAGLGLVSQRRRKLAAA